MPQTMVLHAGGKFVNFEELAKVPLPRNHEGMAAKISDRYATMPHNTMAGLIRSLARETIGPSAILEEHYALAGPASYPGARMFGMMRLNLSLSDQELQDLRHAQQHVGDLVEYVEEEDDSVNEVAIEPQEALDAPQANDLNLPDHWSVNASEDAISPALVFRNSYDSSMTIAFALGYQVFICDNLALSGDIKYSRKHIGNNLRRDVIGLTLDLISRAADQYSFDQEVRLVMKNTEISDRRGYEILGTLAGEGLLSMANGSKSPFSMALRQWRNPTFQVFRDRNLWSLSNAVTFAQGGAGFGKRIEISSRANDVLLAELPTYWLDRSRSLRSFSNN